MPNDYEETLAQLEESLQVRHVAHRPLTTIRADASPAEAHELAARLTLNNLPVVAPNAEIIGVLENLNGEIADYPRPSDSAPVVQHTMRALSDRMLVESRRSLEGLLDDLLVPPYYQLVVTAGQIDGIVTASDLNKAPVRVVSYATVAHLETAMTAAIRKKTNADDEAAVAMLGRDGSSQVRGAHSKLKNGNLNAALLDATTFKQKGTILVRLGVFDGVGSVSVEDEFADLYLRLRNPVMHMSPFVAESIDGLRDFAVHLARARQRTQEALAAAS